MISKHKFFKEAQKYQLPLEKKEIEEFYCLADDLFSEFYAKKQNSDKILEIHEKIWPLLQKLGVPHLFIYQNLDKEEEGMAAMFRNSIKDEKELRQNIALCSSSDYQKAIMASVARRIDFLKEIFDLTEKDIAEISEGKRKKINWKVVAVTTLGVIGGGYALKKIGSNSKKK